MRHTPLARRALLPALAALALAPAGAGAQALTVEPFGGYLVGYRMESGIRVAVPGREGTGTMQREVGGGPAYGLRADVAFSRHLSLYGAAARGETGERQDVFMEEDGIFFSGVATQDGDDVWLLSGGVSYQPAGYILRVYGGPAMTRFSGSGDETVSQVGLQAGAGVAFDLGPRVGLSVGVEDYVIAWDDDAVGAVLSTEFGEGATAQTESGRSHLPVVRAGLAFRL